MFQGQVQYRKYFYLKEEDISIIGTQAENGWMSFFLPVTLHLGKAFFFQTALGIEQSHVESSLIPSGSIDQWFFLHGLKAIYQSMEHLHG